MVSVRPYIGTYVTIIGIKHTDQRVNPLFKLERSLVLALGLLCDSSLLLDYFLLNKRSFNENYDEWHHEHAEWKVEEKW